MCPRAAKLARGLTHFSHRAQRAYRLLSPGTLHPDSDLLAQSNGRGALQRCGLVGGQLPTGALPAVSTLAAAVGAGCCRRALCCCSPCLCTTGAQCHWHRRGSAPAWVLWECKKPPTSGHKLLCSLWTTYRKSVFVHLSTCV